MKKLGIRSIAFAILGIVLVVIIWINFAQNKIYSTTPDRAKLVKMILDEVSDNDGSQRFLIISKYVCRTCFESMLEKLGNDAEMSRNIAIILIGANDYETKMMNAIYKKLNFKSIDQALYKKIEQINVNFAEGAFIGVRKSASGAISIYDGESDYSDISARTAAVFDFILADTLDQTDKKLNNLSTAGSRYPSIAARNSLVLRYPQKIVSINFSTHYIDTINVGFLNVGFLRNMVDTTFEIAAQRAFLLCERGFESGQATYDYSLYEIQNFPKNRKKLFRSNIYLNCVYNFENDVLLFHPTLHGAEKQASVRFDKADLKEVIFDEYFVLLCQLNGHPRYEILKIEKSQKSNHPLPYELGFDGNEIFGHAYDSTGFQLYNYRIEKRVLKITSEAKFELKTNFGVKWLTMEFAHRYFVLRVDKFRNWVILHILDSIGREYIVSKFNIGSKSPVLKEIYRGEDMGGRFHNTNLFLYEDLQSKMLKIIEDVELK